MASTWALFTGWNQGIEAFVVPTTSLSKATFPVRIPHSRGLYAWNVMFALSQ